jgi:hypothetical protein
MAKDSYWFKHDSTAGRGTRMRKMSFIYGHWGKGIYWDVLEILRDQDGYRFEKDEQSIQMLSDLIGCKDPDKLLNWLNDCIKLDLIQSDEKYFFSNVLKANMTKWESTKDAGIQSGKVRKERKLQRNANELLNETRTKREHNIIEDNITDINVDTLFNDLPNSSYIVEIARNNKTTPDKIKSLIPKFRLKANLTYPNQNEFIKHFKNWIPNNINLATEVDLDSLSREDYLKERKRMRDEYDKKTSLDNLTQS